MKFSFFLFSLLAFFAASAQRPNEPFFAMLSNIKSNSEQSLKQLFKMQEMAIDTLSDEPKGNKKKEKKRLENFRSNPGCILAYSSLRTKVDNLIIQLKADLTISNRVKFLKRLNTAPADSNSWYKKAIDEVQSGYVSVLQCTTFGLDATSLADVTGLFSALVGVATSARDFRAQQIKALCEQLDKLRLVDIFELMSGSSVTAKSDEKKTQVWLI